MADLFNSKQTVKTVIAQQVSVTKTPFQWTLLLSNSFDCTPHATLGSSHTSVLSWERERREEGPWRRSDTHSSERLRRASLNAPLREACPETHIHTLVRLSLRMKNTHSFQRTSVTQSWPEAVFPSRMRSDIIASARGLFIICLFLMKGNIWWL